MSGAGATRGRGWPKGRPRSAAHRAAIGAALRGRKLTAEHRAKISAATKGRPRPDLLGNQRGRLRIPGHEIAGMVAEYATANVKDIAARFGYAKQTVRRLLVEAGVEVRPRGTHLRPDPTAAVHRAKSPAGIAVPGPARSPQGQVSTHATQHEEHTR